MTRRMLSSIWQPALLFMCLFLCSIRVDAATHDDRIKLYTAYSCVEVGNLRDEPAVIYGWLKKIWKMQVIDRKLHESIDAQVSAYFKTKPSDEEIDSILLICKAEL